jgi:hypothetical protein
MTVNKFILSYPFALAGDECDRDREGDFDLCRSFEWRDRLRSLGESLLRR